MSLYLDIGPDDALCIGDNMFVTIERKSGKRARLRIIGPLKVELMRKAKLLHPMPNPPSVEDGS